MLSVDHLTRPGLPAVSFELADGECLALRGPSGAGKTLLLRAIADLDPNEGRVRLDGCVRESMPAPKWRSLVTYLAAEPGWWGERVAAHFPDWAAVGPLVEALGLPADCGDWPIARLSTGERQRLALARVLLAAPRVMLLDEPTSGLDAQAAARVEAILKARLEQGVAILLVTHATEQAARMAARRLTMDHGRLSEAPP